MKQRRSLLGMRGCVNSLLSSVNATLNNSIGYVTNADKFGRPDVWEAADIGGTGDCKAMRSFHPPPLRCFNHRIMMVV